jgi:hypothetical protein
MGEGKQRTSCALEDDVHSGRELDEGVEWSPNSGSEQSETRTCRGATHALRRLPLRLTVNPLSVTFVTSPPVKAEEESWVREAATRCSRADSPSVVSSTMCETTGG